MCHLAESRSPLFVDITSPWRLIILNKMEGMSCIPMVILRVFLGLWYFGYFSGCLNQAKYRLTSLVTMFLWSFPLHSYRYRLLVPTNFLVSWFVKVYPLGGLCKSRLLFCVCTVEKLIGVFVGWKLTQILMIANSVRFAVRSLEWIAAKWSRDFNLLLRVTFIKHRSAYSCVDCVRGIVELFYIVI